MAADYRPGAPQQPARRARRCWRWWFEGSLRARGTGTCGCRRTSSVAGARACVQRCGCARRSCGPRELQPRRAGVLLLGRQLAAGGGGAAGRWRPHHAPLHPRCDRRGGFCLHLREAEGQAVPALRGDKALLHAGSVPTHFRQHDMVRAVHCLPRRRAVGPAACCLLPAVCACMRAEELSHVFGPGRPSAWGVQDLLWAMGGRACLSRCQQLQVRLRATIQPGVGQRQPQPCGQPSGPNGSCAGGSCCAGSGTGTPCSSSSSSGIVGCSHFGGCGCGCGVGGCLPPPQPVPPLPAAKPVSECDVLLVGRAEAEWA